jgi:hypothetical protein
MEKIDTCPFCKTNLKGEKIVWEFCRHVLSAKNISRLVIVLSEDGKEALYYECPDCHVRWDYDSNSQVPTGKELV